MLSNVADDVRKHYYDASLHGLDWDASVAHAKQEIEKSNSLDVALLQIAAVLEKLNDSHTHFIPPRYPIKEDYGWEFQMFGKRCYVTRVRPKSDAEAQGLKPGYQVLTISGFTPTIESLPQIEYVTHSLRPLKSLEADIRDASGKIRRLDIKASVRQMPIIADFGDMTGLDAQAARIEREAMQKSMRPRYAEISPSVLAIKLPEFFLTDFGTDELISKARKHEKLILDLRGNPGGAEVTLKYLIGGVFDHEVKIGDRIMRQKTEPLIAKSARSKAFTGGLIVLVDSRSSSAAELFARVVQIEKRGTVLGDRSSGLVMEARYYDHQVGSQPIVSYGAMITGADLMMTDGKSLEHLGVTPDVMIIPTAADLAADSDPALARAAELSGAKLTPEDAGKLFPYEWPAE
jgi:carboxyl-terminal processing protease